MQADWEIYKKAYDAANQQIKDLMSSSVIYDCIIAQLSVSTTIKTSPVVLLIGYHLLGINSMEKTLAELSALEVPDVYNFLNKILKEIADYIAAIPPPPVAQVPVVDLTEELAQTERELESIQGLRTMAQDMHEVQGHAEPIYQSSQSEILNRTIPSVPPPPQTAGPHWDTEQ